MNEPQYNPRLTGIQNFKIAFEKGKLEERERIKEIIDNIKLELFLTDIKDKKGKKIKLSNEIMTFISIWWNEKEKQLQKEIGDNSQQPRFKQTRGGELKSDEGLHSTDNGSPADIVSKEDSKNICICGHHTKDHSYDPNKLDADLECDICDCKRFKTKEDRSFLGGYAELWDNSEDDRWDREYNPDLLPETLKNKEEKQNEPSRT